jgi:Site-specific DNA methylase
MDLGLARAGFQHAFFCESDEWRRRVLAHHWPGVPIYRDVRDVGIEPATRAQADASGTGLGEIGGVDAGAVRVDLIAGGFPCQDVSVAGRRAGLAGAKTGLFFEFARILDAFRPGWVLLENVPGLLSSNGGRDFGIVLGTLADLGYGLGWRVLDSRFFGVPQRRRRVFIVGACTNGDSRTDAERAAEVLSVGARCGGHLETVGQSGQGVAAALEGRPDLSSRVAGTLGALTGGYRTTDLDGNGAYVVSGAEADAA